MNSLAISFRNKLHQTPKLETSYLSTPKNKKSNNK